MKGSKLKEFLFVNMGLVLTAMGIVLFKTPNGFATGGVSGIAIIINKYMPGQNVGLIMLLINIVLDVLGILMLGKDFGIKTIYSSFALSFFVWVGAKLIPLTKPITGDSMLELIFAITLPAIGSAFVFSQNASTGGTDIVAKILTRYTHLHVGKTLLLADFLIAFSALFTLGVRQGMYSVLGLVMKGFIIDMVLEGLYTSKKLEIITSQPQKIENYILQEMHRGITIIPAQGGYTHDEKQLLTVVLSRSQAIKLSGYIHQTDPRAFIVITTTSEIIGKGFRNTDQ
ncbi:MAG TPA: YitT family protein [Clostridia bacterium]|nr:YitT family protein [Clostridia bacterium]